MLAGRGVEDKVWRWDFGRISNRFETFVTLSVEVEIDVADVLYILLGPAVRAVFDGVHSHEHVGAAGTLIGEPSLKAGARYRLSLSDSLDRVASGTMPHEDRGIVCGIEKLPDILGSGERSRCESGVGAHG